jgi:ADP-ribosylglycohydrolase
MYPEGSYANGGVMRIAPVGLVYKDCTNEQLLTAVTDALLCTHVHPEAIDGAYLQVNFSCILVTNIGLLCEKVLSNDSRRLEIFRQF